MIGVRVDSGEISSIAKLPHKMHYWIPAGNPAFGHQLQWERAGRSSTIYQHERQDVYVGLSGCRAAGQGFHRPGRKGKLAAMEFMHADGCSRAVQN